MAEIHLFDIYRSANIGIFLKTNDKFCLVPHGIAKTKSDKIAELLGNTAVPASIASSRLLGPLAALNNRGIVVSRLTDDEEVRHLNSATELNVLKLESRFTSVGNLISANDHGAVISDVFSEESARDVERALEVPVKRMRIGTFVQVGAMISATNSGALVHPIASEQEINTIGKVLGFDPEPATVNGGVPFVGSGFVGNSKSILVGSLTRGSELVILGRAFS
ncbi:MAG: translation initiation factor IF-6 [Thaumarchaeota archaeon]|nr:translation initiation factor IF-6 [Nitrososphaerota archaeon]